MQYNNFVSTKAITYGKDFESVALTKYVELEKPCHENFVVKATGLNINPNFPFAKTSG